jgi:hypothetical protein
MGQSLFLGKSLMVSYVLHATRALILSKSSNELDMIQLMLVSGEDYNRKTSNLIRCHTI